MAIVARADLPKIFGNFFFFVVVISRNKMASILLKKNRKMTRKIVSSRYSFRIRYFMFHGKVKESIYNIEVLFPLESFKNNNTLESCRLFYPVWFHEFFSASALEKILFTSFLQQSHFLCGSGIRIKYMWMYFVWTINNAKISMDFVSNLLSAFALYSLWRAAQVLLSSHTCVVL